LRLTDKQTHDYGMYTALAWRCAVKTKLESVSLSCTRNAWQSPSVARQPQRTHPSEDTPLQRSNRRACCLRDVICNEAAPFRPHRGSVLSAQRVFCPWRPWPLTLTFKLIRPKYQTRLPCEVGATPFSGSCDPLFVICLMMLTTNCLGIF